MIQIHKILFPTDFSKCSSQAMDHALLLAEKCRAELFLFHAIVMHEYDPYNPGYHFPDTEALYKRLKDLAGANMKTALETHEDTSVTIHREHERGLFAPDIILDFAEDQEVDLIVMGTHGRRGLGHLVLGSVVERVVRFSNCPVLTVREKKASKAGPRFSRILVPVDFSDHSSVAVTYASEIAAMFGGMLQLLHVVEQVIHPVFYHGSGRTADPESGKEIKDASEEALYKLYAEAPGPETEVEFHCIEGHPAGTIIRFAEKQAADLIVIGTHGLTGLSHFMLGSVTDKVVRRAPCPVFTVKSFGKSLIA